MTKFDFFKDKLYRDSIVTHAAALAFYATFAIAPLVLLLASTLSAIPISLESNFISEVRALMGRDAAEALHMIFQTIEQKPELVDTANFWGIVALIFSASIVFAQLQNSLDVIFSTATEADTNSTTWKKFAADFLLQRLLCFGMVILFVAISIFSVVASSALSLLVDSHLKALGRVFHYIGTFVIYGGVFAALFHWMPKKRIPWFDALRGGALTATMFVIGKIFVEMYLGSADLGSAYGAAGSLVVALVWVYYSTLIILFGAEVANMFYVYRHNQSSSSVIAR